MTTSPQEPGADAPDGPILADRAEAEAIKDQVSDADADADSEQS